MEKTIYKYIVHMVTDINDCSLGKIIDEKSIANEFEFLHEDPLKARKLALEKAKQLVDYFEDNEEDHIYPPIKWGEEYDGDDPCFLFYQIKIIFKIGEYPFCIFDTGGPCDTYDNNLYEVFSGLQNEYRILKKAGINLRDKVELIKYENTDKKIKKTYILPNSMHWDGFKFNPLCPINPNDLDWGDSFNSKKKKEKRKENKVEKTQKVKLIFKSSCKYRFNQKKDTVVLTFQTTSETIQPDIINSINNLINNLKANN